MWYHVGSSKSSFLLPSLMTHVCRLHTLTSDDKRAVGAAVFIMGKARVAISDSTIDSMGGFGVWVKHGGRVEVSNTNFLRAGNETISVDVW
jgi:hypothetical protein